VFGKRSLNLNIPYDTRILSVPTDNSRDHIPGSCLQRFFRGHLQDVGQDNIKIGLSLRPNAKPLPDIDSQPIIQHVAFLVDGNKFTDAQNAFNQAGIKFDGPEDTGIAFSIVFNDPDGHLLEITTYHPVPPSPLPSTGPQSARGP
jgi:catechol 2,3-dioxygenase-like lactoylglutathione lyase family enzyme